MTTNLTTPACTAQFEHAPEAVSRPTNDLTLAAPLARPHVDLTRPRAELLGKLFTRAELLFRNQPPFAGKVTPSSEADHYDQVPLLVRLHDAAKALDVDADEAAVAFTAGCEESVRYARELADPALRALAETLERASGRERRVESERTDAAVLERRVLERVREATTDELLADCEREESMREIAVNALVVSAKLERVLAYAETLAGSTHDATARDIGRTLKAMCGEAGK